MSNSLLQPIANRKSRIAFSPKQIEKSDIKLLFEAAQLAPSSYNEQPWCFYYITRANLDKFNRFLSLLAPANMEWAQNASLLIFTTANRHLTLNGNENVYARHDVGMATASIIIQAEAMGLSTHIMGGFSKTDTVKLLNLDDNHIPVAVVAVGYTGDILTLCPQNQKRENAKRNRKALGEIVVEL